MSTGFARALAVAIAALALAGCAVYGPPFDAETEVPQAFAVPPQYGVAYPYSDGALEALAPVVSLGVNVNERPHYRPEPRRVIVRRPVDHRGYPPRRR